MISNFNVSADYLQSQCQCRSVYLITFFLFVLKFNKRSISSIKQDDKWTITEVILIAPRVDENFPWKLDFCDTLMDCTHSVDWRSNMLFFLSTVEHERVLFLIFLMALDFFCLWFARAYFSNRDRTFVKKNYGAFFTTFFCIVLGSRSTCEIFSWWYFVINIQFKLTDTVYWIFNCFLSNSTISHFIHLCQVSDIIKLFKLLASTVDYTPWFLMISTWKIPIST